MILQEDNNFWNEFYNGNNLPKKPSSFAQFSKQFMEKDKILVELGCGNGRDAFYFAENNLKVIAIDASAEIIEKNNNLGGKNISFYNDDFTNLQNNSYIPSQINYIYSRFTLHSIVKEDMEKTLIWAINNINDKGILFIEARTINDPLYGVGKEEKDNAFINTHYRRFLITKEVQHFLIQIGFNIISCIEDYTSSWYNDDHAVVLRIIAQK